MTVVIKLQLILALFAAFALYVNFPYIVYLIHSENHKMSKSWVFQQQSFSNFHQQMSGISSVSNSNKNTVIDANHNTDLTVGDNVNSVIKAIGGVLKMFNSKNYKITTIENEFEVIDCTNCNVSP